MQHSRSTLSIPEGPRFPFFQDLCRVQSAFPGLYIPQSSMTQESRVDDPDQEGINDDGKWEEVSLPSSPDCEVSISTLFRRRLGAYATKDRSQEDYVVPTTGESIVLDVKYARKHPGFWNILDVIKSSAFLEGEATSSAITLIQEAKDSTPDRMRFVCGQKAEPQKDHELE